MRNITVQGFDESRGPVFRRDAITFSVATAEVMKNIINQQLREMKGTDLTGLLREEINKEDLRYQKLKELLKQPIGGLQIWTSSSGEPVVRFEELLESRGGRR